MPPVNGCLTGSAGGGLDAGALGGIPGRAGHAAGGGLFHLLARALRKGNESVITVVGCGGDRDRTKRPLMAEAACAHSHKTIFTSDNPRTEDPDAILNDMVAGLKSEYKRKSLVIRDRREAIKTAVMLARPGDIVLVAGKGHEKYQEINGVKHHFDDKEELNKCFEER